MIKMKLQNKKDKYLSERMHTFFLITIGLGLLAVFSILLLYGRSRILCVAAVAVSVSVQYLWGYFNILKPYRLYRDQIQRFLDGYIDVSDLRQSEIGISRKHEELLGRIENIVRSTQTLDLSKRQAQYRALQNQINPHFLYNTLEGIRSEAMIAGLDNVSDMTEALAIFFRYTISKVENLVTVEEELENCRTYFKIQQYRFGDRLKLEILEDEEDWDDILKCQIPKLTLQPILENSIIHGIEMKIGTGKITIAISRTKSDLHIQVKDNGVGMNLETLTRLNNQLSSKEDELKEITQEEKGGVALTNVNNRIHLIFGEEYGMNVFSMESQGTEVSLVIPVVFSENELNLRKRYETGSSSD